MPLIRTAALIALLALLALLAACGNPGPADDDFTFTFDPVPYTVVPQPDGREPLLISIEDGRRYHADRVGVTVKFEDSDEFETWAQTIGFRPIRVSDPRAEELFGRTNFTVLVPPGSVLDAVKVLQRGPGVIEASVGYFANPR